MEFFKNYHINIKAFLQNLKHDFQLITWRGTGCTDFTITLLQCLQLLHVILLPGPPPMSEPEESWWWWGGWCRSWLRVNTSAHWSTSDTALSEVTAVVSTQLRLRQKTEESCSHQGPHNRGGHAGIRIVHLSTSWYIANSTTDFWHFFQILKDAIYVKLKNVKNDWHKYK